MKKFFTLLFSFLFLNSFWSLETDISLFNEMKASYNSKFYPGAIQYSERLINNFPESIYVVQALAIKGESLVKLYQGENAKQVLLDAINLSEKDSLLNSNCIYWLANAFEQTKDYEQALNNYYLYCKKQGTKGVYYLSSINSSAKILYNLSEYNKSIPLFEYFISNGKNTNKTLYADSVLKLADSYNQVKEYEKTISLYKNFNINNIEEDAFYILTSYAGDAYKELSQYNKAYELYCLVLASGKSNLSANALKKAYNLSSLHKKEIGKDPGTVLKEAQMSLVDSKELLSEFWTRMGRDAFEQKDYKKALDYFAEAEKIADDNLLSYIQLCKSEICLYQDSKNNLNKAKNLLLEAEKNFSINKDSKYFEEYNKLNIKYDVLNKEYKNAIQRRNDVKELDKETEYYLAVAYYNTENFVEVINLLKNSESPLYPLSLAKMQRYKESSFAFEKLDQNNKLQDEYRLDYAKVLLYSGRYRESQIQAAKCSQNEAKYILGLAQFNTRSWKYSEESFTSFIKKGTKDEKALSYALFYNGYSQYRLGKNAEAYKNLVNFTNKYPNHELVWNGYITASNAAVQNKDYINAMIQAEKAIKASTTNESREESVLLCAEIYSDSKQYEKAINLLTVYSELKNDFGMKCMYQIGKVYEKQDLINKADEQYKILANNFSNNKLAQEAMFRRGELYYSKGDYKNALNRFNEYSKKYPGGIYLDGAWFFAAECLVKTDNITRGILQHKALIKNFPNSAYTYNSIKNLVELDRSVKNYTEALNYAKLLLDKYGEQARNDGIAIQIAQLEKLSNGLTEEIVQQTALFEAEGGIKTVAGRIHGTKLVLLYVKNSSTYKTGIELAKSIYPLQKNNINQESKYACNIASVLGDDYVKNQSFKTAANYYLEAAEYFRANNESEEAASALYNAVDAFINAQMKADATETAELLKKLYPKSKQAQSVKVL